MDNSVTDNRPPLISLSAIFLKFLRFGFLAFGGPVAQIAMLRQSLVEEERWIDRSRFNKLLAILQVLPGPEAHELCVHFGIIARGRIGGLLAGLGFMLPGFALMLFAGWVYVTWIADHGMWSGPLLGIQIAVLAIILRAVVRIGEHILVDRLTCGIALGSALLTLASVPFWLPLVAGAAIYACCHRPSFAVAIAVFTASIAISLHSLPGGQEALAISHEPSTIAALFIAGLKGGLLTFGGAYTAIPYVRADTVGRGWLSDATFLDGVALAGILPAPLVIFATFAGYVAGALPGALAITAGMFLPAFAFSLIFYERLEAIVDRPGLQRALEGIAAAVVGIIAATFLQLGEAAWLRISSPPMAIILFGFALAAAWRLKAVWVTPAILACGALTGAAVSL
ncbi:chromate efflux transporter [Sphingobium sp. B11D3A]|uniref:chromate efflux transporter n=1 Tax=Sphingobium sp. B11D3A TaxID=2940574 RepID=UPI0022249430|nr:chromate efflux transporter [Sphingobium sp. B11D3A]MCW2393555.1 chromate transporter [Sphingobium sp. B11D3A]